MVLARGVGVPPQQGGVIGAVVVEERPEAVLASRAARGGRSAAAHGLGVEPTPDRLGREVGARKHDRLVDEPDVEADERVGVVRGLFARAPFVELERRLGRLDDRSSGQADPECVAPLFLVEGAREHRDVHQDGRADDPFGEPLLGGGLGGHRGRVDRVAEVDDRGYARIHELGDGRAGDLLAAGRVEVELDIGRDLDAAVLERVAQHREGVGLITTRGVEVGDAVDALGVFDVVAAVDGLAPVELRADHRCGEQGRLLGRWSVGPEQLALADVVALALRHHSRAVAQAHHAGRGELVAKCRRLGGPADHRERVHVDDGLGVGLGCDRVCPRARAEVADEVDLAAPQLIHLFVDAGEPLRGLEGGVRVHVGTGCRDRGGELGVQLGIAHVEHDVDGVRGDAGPGRAAVAVGRVVRLDARRGVDRRDLHLAEIGVAARAPVDVVGPALLFGLGVDQGQPGLVARVGGAVFGRRGVVIVAAGQRDDGSDDRDHHHDHDDRSVAAQGRRSRAVGLRRGHVGSLSCRIRRRGYRCRNGRLRRRRSRDRRRRPEHRGRHRTASPTR